MVCCGPMLFLKLQWVICLLSLCLAFFGAFSEARSRCVCACPRNLSFTEDRTVFIEPMDERKNCKCDKVVKNATSIECLHCQCRYETLRVVVIEGVIIIILVVLGILVLYMLYLSLDNLYAMKYGRSLWASKSTHLGRQTSHFDQIRSSTERWRRGLVEQRKNVFDRHTMLS